GSSLGAAKNVWWPTLQNRPAPRNAVAGHSTARDRQLGSGTAQSPQEHPHTGPRSPGEWPRTTPLIGAYVIGRARGFWASALTFQSSAHIPLQLSGLFVYS